MKKTLRLLLAGSALCALTANPVLAHRFWIVPAMGVLSGNDPWVTFDAAVSNSLFFPDHHAPDLEGFAATGPDGQPVPLQNGAKGKYRTTFDLRLEKEGTYKVATVRELTFARWQENGENKSFRGSASEFQKAGLEGKEGLTVTENISRVETFVTRGTPNLTAIEPTGRGLEISYAKTHPNDLFAGEKATFTLLLKGQPAANTKVTVIKGDDRYRTSPDEITLTTNEQGEFEITWPEAGRWWLNASVGEGGRNGQRNAYTAVYEVLPE